ncbi:hypothetical protein B0H16DRAFT_1480625 [Mycena metata]|uniref:Uncharacterized protein n=1 Tax=Mycena metata TaxID=1033252 RepID=A0AAD7H316_9AGAR|nr:hypothetical protein B0H16DRAFT_1480625 [Mycena metata]
MDWGSMETGEMIQHLYTTHGYNLIQCGTHCAREESTYDFEHCTEDHHDPTYFILPEKFLSTRTPRLKEAFCGDGQEEGAAEVDKGKEDKNENAAKDSAMHAKWFSRGEPEETSEPEPIPEKGYGLSMELVEFEDLNSDDEIFGIPEDQDKQPFGQESTTPKSWKRRCQRSSQPPREWLDTLKQITFSSQAGDIEAGNLLRQRLAKLEQKVLREEAKENQAASQGIAEDIDPEVEDLVDIQNDKDDNEIAERVQVKVPRRPQAFKIVEAPRRLNYIILPEEVPQADPVKGKKQKEIDNLF